MRSQAGLPSIFYVALFIAVALVSSALYFHVFSFNTQLIAGQIQRNAESNNIMPFRIEDPSISITVTNGTPQVVEISFYLTNLGSESLSLTKWMLDFIDTSDTVFCSQPVFMSQLDATNLGVYGSGVVINTNTTIGFGNYIPPSQTAQVTIYMLSSPTTAECLYPLYNYLTKYRSASLGLRLMINGAGDTVELECQPTAAGYSCSVALPNP